MDKSQEIKNHQVAESSEVPQAADTLVSLEGPSSDPLKEPLPDEDSTRNQASKIRLPADDRFSIDRTKLPELPPLQSIQERIQGICSLPFEKQITNKDVSNGRLTLNKKTVEEHCKGLVWRKHRKESKERVKVIVYGPDGEGLEMAFRFDTRSRSYVVDNGWDAFVDKHGLKGLTHWLTFWMFRHKDDDSLCFAITWKFMQATTSCIRRNQNDNKKRKRKFAPA